ncbi:MAG: hypothetical protein ABFD92_08140 [Planctomycetaceae bacterium]|nr:hypothetical protein [Planctomycetaceae bacterium]
MTIQGWPICLRCHDFHQRAAKSRTKLAILSVLIIAALMALHFYLATVAALLPADSLLFVLPGAALMAVAAVIYIRTAKRRLAASMGIPFSHLPVKLIRSGKQAFRDGNILEVFCYHMEYAMAYREANRDNGQVSIN